MALPAHRCCNCYKPHTGQAIFHRTVPNPNPTSLKKQAFCLSSNEVLLKVLLSLLCLTFHPATNPC